MPTRRRLFAALLLIGAVSACSAQPAQPVASSPATTPSSAAASPAQSSSTQPAVTTNASAASSASSAAATSPSSPAPKAPAAVDCKVEKCIALTYDDGPSQLTPKLLQTFHEKNAQATFFLIGQNAANLPEIVKQTADLGFEIGNHSWSHPDLTTVSADQIQSELARTSQTISQIIGQPVKLMRPPYGSYNNAVLNGAARNGLSVVHWTNSPEDWQANHRSPEIIAKLTVERASPGSIILMHDIHQWTVDAAPATIDALQAQGYHLVTVSQLVGDTQPGELLPR